MNLNTFFSVIAWLVVGLIFYSQYSWRNKILCFFHRPNRTLIEKKVPLKSKYVFFSGGKYIVNPKRISLQWYTRGINSFFPMLIPTLTFKWDDTQPLDPTDFTNTWRTPEAWKAANQEESYVAFNKGAAAQTGTKKGMFPDWFWHVITIGLIAVVGYWVYQLSGQVALLRPPGV